MNAITLFTFFLFLLSPIQIHCYLDPVSGSIIIQILIASFVGGAYAVKVFWQQIKSFCKNKKS
jgi:hypothetical protein